MTAAERIDQVHREELDLHGYVTLAGKRAIDAIIFGSDGACLCDVPVLSGKAANCNQCLEAGIEGTDA